MPHEFEAQDADLRTSAFPGLVKNNGTNIPVSGYAFDAATAESIFFRFKASDYVSGDIIVLLDWYADTASSGAVMWGCQIAAITPNTDTQDIETDSLGTQVTTTTTHLGTVGQRLHRTSVTITGSGPLDSVATDDQVVLCVQRVAANAGDTMTGDCVLVYVSIAA